MKNLVKSLSHSLAQRLRKSDIIGRVLTDTFAIILPETDINDAEVLVEDIQKRLNQRACQILQSITPFPVSIAVIRNSALSETVSFYASVRNELKSILGQGGAISTYIDRTKAAM